MSEREKMLAGAIYNCLDAELRAMAVAARRRVAAYCATDPGDEEARWRLLGEIFAEVGPGVHIEPPFYVDYGVHTSIGESTFINVNCMIIDDAAVKIGRNCLLGPACQLVTAMHPVKASDRRASESEVAAGESPWRTMSAPVTIGAEVWLGAGAIVLPGVTIGDRCMVGAGSVVTRDLPPDSLAVGTPARVVKSL
ncbi:MAG TPA: sugar O-acetyltransferase [Acidimicrobiales bacterium]|nr:sugar O-acetyltransferase [Acidimicrobiales bacterium]